jgi:mannosyltransferase
MRAEAGRSPAAVGGRATATEWLGLLAVLVVGVVLRVPGVRAWYWGDEIQTVVIARRSLSDIPAALERDGAPPFFYVLLHGWMQVFGSSETSTHALTLLISMVTVVAAWWWARRYGGLCAGLLAAAAIAVNPYLVRYATETRNYALFALLGVVTLGLSLDVLGGKRTRAHYALGVIVGLTMLTHSWGIFFAAAVIGVLTLAATTSRDSDLVRRTAVAAALSALVFVPWLPTFAYQTRHTGAPWNVRYSIFSTLDQMTPYVGGRGSAALLLAAVLVGGVAALAAGRLPTNTVLLGAACAATPALAFIVSFIDPIWQARYGIVVVGAGLVVIAIVAARTRVGAASFAAVVVVMALFAVRDVKNAAADGKPDARFRRVADVIAPIDPDIAIADEGTLGQLRYELGDDRGADVQYLSPLGVLADPTFYDWRDDLDRLRAAVPDDEVDSAVSEAAPGTVVVVLRRADPGVSAGLGGDTDNEWQRLYATRAAEVAEAALADERFSVVGSRTVEGWIVTTLVRR